MDNLSISKMKNFKLWNPDNDFIETYYSNVMRGGWYFHRHEIFKFSGVRTWSECLDIGWTGRSWHTKNDAGLLWAKQQESWCWMRSACQAYQEKRRRVPNIDYKDRQKGRWEMDQRSRQHSLRNHFAHNTDFVPEKEESRELWYVLPSLCAYYNLYCESVCLLWLSLVLLTSFWSSTIMKCTIKMTMTSHVTGKTVSYQSSMHVGSRPCPSGWMKPWRYGGIHADGSYTMANDHHLKKLASQSYEGVKAKWDQYMQNQVNVARNCQHIQTWLWNTTGTEGRLTAMCTVWWLGS